MFCQRFSPWKTYVKKIKPIRMKPSSKYITEDDEVTTLGEMKVRITNYKKSLIQF